MEDSSALLKYQSQNVQIFGFVCRSTNGRNHCPELRIQSKGICAVTLWQDCYGERQFEKVLLQQGWEKDPNWEEGRCGRLGGHCPNCVARSYRSLWILGRKLRQRQLWWRHCDCRLLWTWLCLSSLQCIFSVACVARGLTVTEPITPATVFRVVAAWVCVAVEAWVLVATRVRSYKLSKTIMTATIRFKFGGRSWQQRSPVSLVL